MALMLENRCILGLSEEAMELRAKVADMKKSIALVKSISAKQRGGKWINF